MRFYLIPIQAILSGFIPPAIALGFSLATPLFFSATASANNLCQLALTQLGAPESLLKKAGTNSDFGGPNCYNAALIATGVLAEGQFRYVHSSEFEFYLKQYFDLVQGEPQPGDLVLYNPRDRRDHAAFFVGSGIVFDKKDADRQAPYRRISIQDVFAPEKLSTDQFIFYRRKPVTPILGEPITAQGSAVLDWVRFVETQVLKSAPAWQVSKNLGYFFEDLVFAIFATLSSANPEITPSVQLARLKLESLAHQVNHSIEETSFSSRYASARGDAIRAEIYLGDKILLREILKKAASVYGRTPTETSLDSAILRLEQNRSNRYFPVLELVKNL